MESCPNCNHKFEPPKRKRCYACGKSKVLKCFTKDNSRHDGLDPRCNNCKSLFAKARRQRIKNQLAGIPRPPVLERNPTIPKPRKDSQWRKPEPLMHDATNADDIPVSEVPE